MSPHRRPSMNDVVEAALKLNKAKKRQKTHLVGMVKLTITWGIIAGLVYLAFPGDLPLPRNLFWTGRPITEILAAIWPLFAWSLGMSLLISLVIKRSRADALIASLVHKYNMGIAVQAGVLEELVFRYFAFIAMLGIVPFLNWCAFGWNGGGLLLWFYTVVMVPIANWATLGLMSSLLATTPWFVGAALLSANAMFRNGHKYQGIIGIVNSWYIGMFLFWIMFQFGLIVAIIVHILYDVIVFTVEHLDVTVFNNR